MKTASIVITLLLFIKKHNCRCRCPAHSQAYSGPINTLKPGASTGALAQQRNLAHNKPQPDYAFEVGNYNYVDRCLRKPGNTRVEKLPQLTTKALILFPWQYVVVSTSK